MTQYATWEEIKERNNIFAGGMNLAGVPFSLYKLDDSMPVPQWVGLTDREIKYYTMDNK